MIDYSEPMSIAKRVFREMESEAAAKMFTSAAAECAECIEHLRAVLDMLLARADGK